jgi:hypothetical protein
MLDKSVVRSIVGDVAEGYEEGERRKAKAHDDLGKPGGHGKSSFKYPNGVHERLSPSQQARECE